MILRSAHNCASRMLRSALAGGWSAELGYQGGTHWWMCFHMACYLEFSGLWYLRHLKTRWYMLISCCNTSCLLRPVKWSAKWIMQHRVWAAARDATWILNLKYFDWDINVLFHFICHPWVPKCLQVSIADSRGKFEEFWPQAAQSVTSRREMQAQGSTYM